MTDPDDPEPDDWDTPPPHRHLATDPEQQIARDIGAHLHYENYRDERRDLLAKRALAKGYRHPTLSEVAEHRERLKWLRKLTGHCDPNCPYCQYAAARAK